MHKTPQTVYLDSCFIISGYLWGGPTKELEELCKNEIHHLIGVRRKHPNILVVIPQIVLGEIMVEMFEKEKLGYIEKMGELIRRLKAETPTINEDILRVALKFFERKEERLKPNDILIAAHGLYDKNSVCLLTIDRELIENKTIHQILKELKMEDKRIRDFSVRDSFRKRRQ